MTSSPMATTKCGLVALIGAPNAGKSTLTNAIVGEKVSIVTHKVQTTRQRITGIGVFGDTQLVLLDTPGLFTPKVRLEKAMVEAAHEAAKDADLRLWIVDISKPLKQDVVTEMLDGLTAPFIVVLNKIDQVDSQKLLERAALFNHPRIEKVFMISALNNDGVSDVIENLCACMPASPWLYPHDDISTLPARLLAADLTREQVILNLHQELPYDTYVETEAFETFRNGSIKISQAIIVAKEGQKAIVLGHKGERIKLIRERSQASLQALFGTQIHLFIHVKVVANWQERKDFYEMSGLNFSVK